MLANAGILILLTAAVAGAQATPVAPPAPSVPMSTSATAPPAAPIKPLNKRYLLSHSSPVYKAPDTNSTVLAHVKAKTHVRVVGITGDWLKIKMSSGKTGFVPMKAAE
jgi:uncharacterized protein YgiM (DUF1202 family)